ncbi:MAG: hypothetical protein KatS3mg121_1523 [Gammaproteobacteria bacterium]|nr:MAG: hypothetical protein KatS3mg121_1523 [Gammaproteobacteria bacterium]
MVPDVLCLPWQEGEWSLLLDGDRALLRRGPYAGFACERDLLDHLLARSLDEAGARPQRLRLWHRGEAAAPALPELEIDAETVTDPFTVLARGVDPRAPLNLLQGPFQRKRDYARLVRPYRLPLALAAAALIAAVGLRVLAQQQLAEHRERLEAEIESVYRQVFPNSRNLTAPRRQLENRLAELAPGAAGGPSPAARPGRGRRRAGRSGGPAAHRPAVQRRSARPRPRRRRRAETRRLQTNPGRPRPEHRTAFGEHRRRTRPGPSEDPAVIETWLQTLRERWDTLAPRERLYLGLGAVLSAVLLFYALLWLPLERNIARLEDVTARQVEDLQWMREAAARIRALEQRGAGRLPAGGSLLALVDQRLIAAGLKSALARMEPDGPDAVKLWLNGAAFDRLVLLLGELEQNHGIRVASLAVTATDTPGLVDARLTLRKPGRS